MQPLATFPLATITCYVIAAWRNGFCWLTLVVIAIVVHNVSICHMSVVLCVIFTLLYNVCYHSFILAL